ncbi:hypothetical protein [Brevundimonas viscosa]|uniref:hypothetical protein n=1 Tax=Brevundimonas viscosa TaxID=871741 RepID=UPI000A4C4DD9|nr:hypothetical protein [Brevundimonas viscosa]
MSPRHILRLAGPAATAVLVAAAVAALVLLAHGLGFRWDPFDRTGRQIAAAEARAAAAEADAAARRLEREGAAAQRRRLDIHHQQALALERATARAEAGARSAHDADQPLDPDRVRRLADHDRELCRIAAHLCDPAANSSADGGDDTLSAGSPAGPADAGGS